MSVSRFALSMFLSRSSAVSSSSLSSRTLRCRSSDMHGRVASRIRHRRRGAQRPYRAGLTATHRYRFGCHASCLRGRVEPGAWMPVSTSSAYGRSGATPNEVVVRPLLSVDSTKVRHISPGPIAVKDRDELHRLFRAIRAGHNGEAVQPAVLRQGPPERLRILDPIIRPREASGPVVDDLVSRNAE